MIFAKVSISSKDSAEYTRLKKFFKGKAAYVTIGVHEDAGRYPTGVDVVQVALWNEFGTETVPERSFFRSTMAENETRIESFRNVIIKQMFEDKWTPEQALDALGLYIQNLVQNKIKSNVAPAYGTGKKGATAREIASRQAAKVSRVGHANTLRETELLLRSITYKVVVE